MLMLTETDGFTRRSINKVNVNSMAYSNQNNTNHNMLRRPSDQRMGTHHLPKINKMPIEKQNSNSRKPVMKMNNEYSPGASGIKSSQFSNKRSLQYQSSSIVSTQQQRNTRNLNQRHGAYDGVSSNNSIVKIVDMQSNLKPIDKSVIYLNNGKIDPRVLKNHTTLKGKNSDPDFFQYKPKTPNQIYGNSMKSNNQYFDKPPISSYRKNMTPLINYGSTKFSVKPMKSTVASNYQGLSNNVKKMRRTGRDFRNPY